MNVFTGKNYTDRIESFDDDWYFNMERRVINEDNVENFKKYINYHTNLSVKDISVLDCGAGKGNIVEILDGEVKHSYGYELSEELIKKRVTNNIIKRDFTLPFLNDFDFLYINSFMYLNKESINDFFINNIEKFKGIYFLYPHRNNGDKLRVNYLDQSFFSDIADKYGLFLLSDKNINGKIMIKKEYRGDYEDKKLCNTY